MGWDTKLWGLSQLSWTHRFSIRLPYATCFWSLLFLTCIAPNGRTLCMMNGSTLCSEAETILPENGSSRTTHLMNAHVRDALVTDFDQLIGILQLSDPDDRHVLAAAIKGRADLIVTANLKDFPRSKLAPWGIEAQHPDEFLTHQFHLSQPQFLAAVKAVRLRLKNPPKTVEDYLDTLRAQGLLATVRTRSKHLISSLV